MRFSEDQIRQARRADLVAYLSAKGYRLRREAGNWRLPGRGGLLVQGNHFFWFSTGKGGNAVDFLMTVLGMSFGEAVTELLNHGAAIGPGPSIGPIRCRPGGREEFRLPERGPDHRRVAAYLTRTRGLSPTLVERLLAEELLYQDLQGNCVFPCYDRAGRPRGAFVRGTSTASTFKGLAPGSDAGYPWHWPAEDPSRPAVVCESPIDALSLASLKPPLRTCHLVGLNGSGSRWSALANFLEEWPEIEIVVLALDNDQAGRQAAEEFGRRLKKMGYAVGMLWPPEGFKDWNEALVTGEEGTKQR